MGTVIRFPIERRLAAKKVARRDGETATIITFPLVRPARRSFSGKGEPVKKIPAVEIQSI